jgi:magnesium-transporting ATPase (P-type)
VESDLEIVGATAIEDALQDECRETISIVREAGINLWVLTGDKIETALNIGYSVNIIDKKMTLYRHRKPTRDEIEKKFREHERRY